MIEYAEPLYPITKTEKFDEDNCSILLRDDMFAGEDRKRLSDYNRHRISGGMVNVCYKLSAGCEEYQLGRLFPVDGMGMGAFRFDIRNPLAHKYYWDVDFENCHYAIAEMMCIKHDLPHQHISHYINNREECLLLVSPSRKKAKVEFLKILYGGDLTLYKSHYQDQDEPVNTEGMLLLRQIKSQVETLMNVLWDNHHQYHKLKLGKDKIMLCKKPNHKASLMSLLFQTIERKMLMFFDHLLRIRGRKLSVFIHDGGYVEKIDGETQMPTNILDECSQEIVRKFGVRSKLTQKTIEFVLATQPKLSQYEIRKKEFEKTHAMVGNDFIFVQPDGTLEFIKHRDMTHRYLCNNWMEYDTALGKNIKKYFFKEWLEDPTHRSYIKVDFIPDKAQCPDNVFNLFRGFKVEELITEEINEQIAKLSPLEKTILLKPIIRHLDFLTSGSPAYILKWLANIVQNPMNRSQVAILIRDMGGFLSEGGGTGKNLFFEEWFGREILGDRLTYVVGDNRELYGNFNSQFEGKLLVMVEEASGKDNHVNADILKAKITARKQNVNKKCVASYEVNDYTNYLFTTNGRNALPFKQGNRRLCAFETNPYWRGNTQYFDQLKATFKLPLIKVLFFYFLKSIPTYDSPSGFQSNIPNNDVYRELRVINAPLHLKWIVDRLESGSLSDGYMNELYDDFKDWVKKTREGREESIMSMTAFGRLIHNNIDGKDIASETIYDGVVEDTVAKHKTHGKMYVKWSIPRLVKGLNNIGLLDDDFAYEYEGDKDDDETVSL